MAWLAVGRSFVVPVVIVGVLCIDHSRRTPTGTVSCFMVLKGNSAENWHAMCCVQQSQARLSQHFHCMLDISGYLVGCCAKPTVIGIVHSGGNYCMQALARVE